jgi:type II secretory pathway pseudopilin PulG
MKIFIKNKISEGFTLVEALVAIAILLLVVTATLGAASNALSTNTFSREQVTAYFLAQEAIEDIKNIRHENNLNSAGAWLCGSGTSFTGFCNAETPFGINNSGTGVIGFVNCINSTSCLLKFDSSTGLYGSVGQASPFTRIVQIAKSGDSALVTVTISWTKGNRESSLTVQETLYNWL